MSTVDQAVLFLPSIWIYFPDLFWVRLAELADLGSFPSPRPFSSDKPQLVRTLVLA